MFLLLTWQIALRCALLALGVIVKLPVVIILSRYLNVEAS